jgi:hypothetical protein
MSKTIEVITIHTIQLASKGGERITVAPRTRVKLSLAEAEDLMRMGAVTKYVEKDYIPDTASVELDPEDVDVDGDVDVDESDEHDEDENSI